MLFSRAVHACSPLLLQGGDAPLEHLCELPMDRYADVEIPAPWFVEYCSLTPSEQVALLRLGWQCSTPADQQLILSDMEYFFGLRTHSM